MNLETLGRTMIGIALALLVVGLILFFLGKGLGLAELPGDIRRRFGNVGIFFPIVTSIIISIVLTVIINAVLYFTRR